MMSDEKLGEVCLFGFFRAFKSSRKVMFVTERFRILISESSLKFCDLIQLSVVVVQWTSVE